MYEQASQTDGASEGAPESDGGANGAPAGDVVDAEFEEVDKDKS